MTRNTSRVTYPLERRRGPVRAAGAGTARAILAGMITKKQATEIDNRDDSLRCGCSETRYLLEALDRAGAFVAEPDPTRHDETIATFSVGISTLSEIADVARTLLKHQNELTIDGLGMGKVAALTLRLASACRAAGLVKP